MKKLLTMGALLVALSCLGACGMPDGDVDVTLQDVMETNSLEVLLDRHDNILIKEELVDINGYVRDTTYRYFAVEDGQMVGDIWNVAKEDRPVLNARNGAVYGLSGGQTNVAIIPEADYGEAVESMFPLLPDPETDVLQSAVKIDKEILITTVRETFSDGSPSRGAEFILNTRNLEIKSVQLIEFNEKGQKTEITGFMVKKNSKEKPDTSAWSSASQPEDGRFCTVTAVLQPGTDAEEERTLQVTRGCSVEVVGTGAYSYYSDKACKDLISTVDTDSDHVTFYAKAAE